MSQGETQLARVRVYCNDKFRNFHRRKGKASRRTWCGDFRLLDGNRGGDAPDYDLDLDDYPSWRSPSRPSGWVSFRHSGSKSHVYRDAEMIRSFRSSIEYGTPIPSPWGTSHFDPVTNLVISRYPNIAVPEGGRESSYAPKGAITHYYKRGTISIFCRCGHQATLPLEPFARILDSWARDGRSEMDLADLRRAAKYLDWRQAT